MKTLIIGAGALGGTIATRAAQAGMAVSLAVRTTEAARQMQESGLRVTGVGGETHQHGAAVAALDEYIGKERFDLVLLATKAHEALALAEVLPGLLGEDGTVLPIQNGGVAFLLAEKLGPAVLGGISHLGATMVAPGIYEQRNAGRLVIGELAGSASGRAERVAAALRPAIAMEVAGDFASAMWTKLVLNCSVTTIGALAGEPMREYYTRDEGRELFHRAHDEAVAVAKAAGAQPKILAIPEILATYGQLKPSMLQDIERGRPTEIDFINGYVATLGTRLGLATPANAAITARIRAIERGESRPGPEAVMLCVHQSR